MISIARRICFVKVKAFGLPAEYFFTFFAENLDFGLVFIYNGTILDLGGYYE